VLLAHQAVHLDNVLSTRPLDDLMVLALGVLQMLLLARVTVKRTVASQALVLGPILRVDHIWGTGLTKLDVLLQLDLR